MHIIRLYLFFVAAALVPLLAQETVIVRPIEIDDVLINPGIGFMTFQRFNGDKLNEGLKWTEGYPIQYQEFKGSLENPNHPMTSIAYFRVYWKFIEPEQGKYRWELLDTALDTAHQRQQTLMLRIAPYGTTTDNDVPDWFRAMMGPEPTDKSRVREVAHRSRKPALRETLHRDGPGVWRATTVIRTWKGCLHRRRVGKARAPTC
jgi:hypothetical protein